MVRIITQTGCRVRCNSGPDQANMAWRPGMSDANQLADFITLIQRTIRTIPVTDGKIAQTVEEIMRRSRQMMALAARLQDEEDDSK